MQLATMFDNFTSCQIYASRKKYLPNVMEAILFNDLFSHFFKVSKIVTVKFDNRRNLKTLHSGIDFNVMTHIKI